MMSRLVGQGSRALTRSMATHARGVPALLKKKPEDVVLTFARRTAMARARKGQLKDVPVDELMQALIKVGGLRVSWLRRVVELTLTSGEPGEE